MKKLISLLKACMSSDMNILRISSKKRKGKASIVLPIILAVYLMGYFGFISFGLFSELDKNNNAYVLLSVFAAAITLLTLIEGIYKTSSLLFNCKDDDLLGSLPIKKSTIIFIRIFKFYVFELLYNSLFLLPIILAYIPFNKGSYLTYAITSISMLLLLPIVPIAISCIIGVITASISSRFKHKNLVQIIFSFALLVGVFYVSMNGTKFMDYLVNNASKLNDLIVKYYYPAGVFGKLASNFNILDLLIFIGINILILLVTIFLISLVYFKINTRVKSSTIKRSKNKNTIIKERSVRSSLIRKELNTFFNTPVFIINSGFGLVLFILIVVLMIFKVDMFSKMFIHTNTGDALDSNILMNNISLVILMMMTFTALMTSITNSVISLEGRNINILKSLPVKVKTILMSKIYACMVITTPVFILGLIALFIRFRFNILEFILLLVLAIVMPLISHFIGILINLKYPKLDAENSAEVVKQSTSSLVSVMIGMGIMFFDIAVIVVCMIIGINPKIVLGAMTLKYIIIDSLLYLILNKWGTKRFNSLEA
jgi:ABC-2 type transport system permease protein